MDKERFKIRDYARIHGTAAPLEKYISKYPNIKESNSRDFKSKVKKEVKNVRKEKNYVRKSVSKYSVPTGRP